MAVRPLDSTYAQSILNSEVLASGADAASATALTATPSASTAAPASNGGAERRAELEASGGRQRRALIVQAAVNEVRAGLARPVITGDFLVKTGQTLERLTSEQASEVFSQLKPAELNKLAAFSSTPTRYFSAEQRQQLYEAIANKLDGQQATRFAQAFGRSQNRQEASQVFGQAINASRRQETVASKPEGAPNTVSVARQTPPAAGTAAPATSESQRSAQPDAPQPTAGAAPASPPTALIQRMRQHLDRTISIAEKHNEATVNAAYGRGFSNDDLKGIGEQLAYGSGEQKTRFLTLLTQKLSDESLNRVNRALRPEEQRMLEEIKHARQAASQAPAAAPPAAPSSAEAAPPVPAPAAAPAAQTVNIGGINITAPVELPESVSSTNGAFSGGKSHYVQDAAGNDFTLYAVPRSPGDTSSFKFYIRPGKNLDINTVANDPNSVRRLTSNEVNELLELLQK